MPWNSSRVGTALLDGGRATLTSGCYCLSVKRVGDIAGSKHARKVCSLGPVLAHDKSSRIRFDFA